MRRCLNDNKPVPDGGRRRFCSPRCFLDFADGRERKQPHVMPGYFEESPE